jgi:Zn-dependent protease
MDLDWIEIQDLIISILVLGFAFSFRHWGAQQFNWSAGFNNFILITFLVAFSFLIHEITHRIAARNSQADLRYRAWKFGLLLALIFAFLTQGWFVFAAVGIITIVPLRRTRSGKYKSGWGSHLGPYERAKIALSGPMANLGLAIISIVLFNATASFVFEKLFMINAWLAIMNLFPFFRSIPHALWRALYPLPPHRRSPPFLAAQKGDERLLPRSEGEIIFFGSRPLWAFAFFFVLISCILLYLFKAALASVILAFLIGFVLFMVWHYYVEPWSYETKKKKPHHYKA